MKPWSRKRRESGAIMNDEEHYRMLRQIRWLLVGLVLMGAMGLALWVFPELLENRMKIMMVGGGLLVAGAMLAIFSRPDL